MKQASRSQSHFPFDCIVYMYVQNAYIVCTKSCLLAVSDYVVRACMSFFFVAMVLKFWYTIVPIAIGLEGMLSLKMKGIESNRLMCRAKLHGNHMDRLTLRVAQ